MLYDGDNEQDRPATYRTNAETLRRIALGLRFDLCRRRQLERLADGFDRLADRVKQPRAKEAAD